MCRDCLAVEPDWPEVMLPPPPEWAITVRLAAFIDPDTQLDGLLGVVKALSEHAGRVSEHRVRTAAAEARVTCPECGCLCLADEPCPNCRINTCCDDRYRLARTSLVHIALDRSTLERA